MKFDQPVLDTLLLSAVVHPNQESHRLEAIAERFDVTVIGRHTALGDALVTAEIFQKLVPLACTLSPGQLHSAGRHQPQRPCYGLDRWPWPPHRGTSATEKCV